MFQDHKFWNYNKWLDNSSTIFRLELIHISTLEDGEHSLHHLWVLETDEGRKRISGKLSEWGKEGVNLSEGERAAHLTNRHHPRGLLCHSLRKITSPPEGDRGGGKSVLHIFRGGRRRWTSDLIAVERWQRQLDDRKPFEVLRELICRIWHDVAIYG